MEGFSSETIKALVSNTLWDKNDYLFLFLNGPTGYYCYHKDGQYVFKDEPVPLAEMVENRFQPVCRHARARALIEAYQQPDGTLVLQNAEQKIGIIFHPSTTVAGHVQATTFDSRGFSGHSSYTSLEAAVEEFGPTYCEDGRDFILAVFGGGPTH